MEVLEGCPSSWRTSKTTRGGAVPHHFADRGDPGPPPPSPLRSSSAPPSGAGLPAAPPGGRWAVWVPPAASRGQAHCLRSNEINPILTGL